ncbi:MAG: twin-arginine translocation signal domain-containing protein [Thermomicrobiales bacterium]
MAVIFLEERIMCSGENDDFCPEEPEKAVESPRALMDDGVTETPLHRRKFLKAAAIGTAVAAFAGKGINFGPLSAYADVLTNVNCTANDVRISGPGIIINEPCSCPTGKFDAQVKFRIINNTGTSRYCVTSHLCPGRDAAGNIVVPAQDIIFGTIGPNFNDFVTVAIKDYPCGAGSVCFGAAGSGVDGGFAKGETCPAGQCCTIISWNVVANDACPQPHSDIIKSKCRAQQVCIIGRGKAKLDCDPTTATDEAFCTVGCGKSTIVRLSTSSATSFGPFKFALSDGQTYQGVAGETFHDFTVGPLTALSTTLTGTVTDNTGCPSSDSTELRTSPTVKPAIENPPKLDCDGTASYKITNFDSSLSYNWYVSVNNAPTGSSLGTGQTLTHQWPQDDASHCVIVTVTNSAGACAQNSDEICVTVPKAIILTLADPTGGCDGKLTYKASATGGVPGYTFTWLVDDAIQDGITGDTLSYGPVLDGACHKIQVKVKDSKGCDGNGARTKGISQCVTSTTTQGGCPA